MSPVEGVTAATSRDRHNQTPLYIVYYMSKYFTREACELFGIQFGSYFILTLNYRAIATINYPGTFITDIVVAMLSFASIKRVAAANTTTEARMGYVLGGATGAMFALWLSTFLFSR